MQINTTNLDFIGDIHGHADALRKLLKGLGYSDKSGPYDYFGECAPPISEQSEPPLLGMDLMM